MRAHATNSQARRFATQAAAFLRNRAGGTAVIFALCFIPLMVVVGLAVDYARDTGYSTDLKVATDAAALAGATITSDPKNPQNTNLKAIRLAAARAAFNANIRSVQALSNVQFAMTELPNGVRVTTSAVASNIFGKLLHDGKTHLGATAEAALAANTNYEVVFVLDNTGSMQDYGKIAVLKTAMFKFLNKLQAGSNASANVHVGLVPFDKVVRFNPVTARGKDWMRQPLRDLSQWNGCITDRQQNYDVDATTPNLAVPETLFDAVDGNLNLFPITPISVSPVPPLPFSPVSCNLAVMQPLTNNFGSMHAAVNAMVPNGNTNLTIGLAWGLQMLSPGEPFNTATPFGGSYTKIMVFLTDGQNTQNRWTSNAPDIDARTQLVCNAIKAKGVVLYTIGLMDENKPLLTSCASSPAKHFFVPNPSQIPDLFDMISSDMVTVRLVR